MYLKSVSLIEDCLPNDWKIINIVALSICFLGELPGQKSENLCHKGYAICYYTCSIILMYKTLKKILCLF